MKLYSLAPLAAVMILSCGCAVKQYAMLKDKVVFERVVYRGVSYDSVYEAAKRMIGTYFTIEEDSRFAGVIASGFAYGWYENSGARGPRSNYRKKALASVDALGDGRVELRLAVTNYDEEPYDIAERREGGEEVITRFTPGSDAPDVRHLLLDQINTLLGTRPAERNIIRPPAPLHRKDF